MFKDRRIFSFIGIYRSFPIFMTSLGGKPHHPSHHLSAASSVLHQGGEAGKRRIENDIQMVLDVNVLPAFHTGHFCFAGSPAN